MTTIFDNMRNTVHDLRRSWAGAVSGGGNALPVLLIVLAAGGAYLNTLQNGFVYDDSHQVLRNPWIRDLRHLPEIFTTSVWDFIPGATSNYYRPMMHVIYLIAYQLFGPAAWGFHLINVSLHIGVSVMVYLVARRLLASSHPADARVPASALLAALVFAVHPIHTEVVAWIAAVPELSYSFFLLLSFYGYVRSGDEMTGALPLSAASYFAATLCKEPALLLPVLLVLYDHCYGRRTEGLPMFLRRYAPYLAAAGLYLVLRYSVLGGLSPLAPHIKLDIWGYVINVFPVFSRYLIALILPVGLNFYHVFHPLASLLEPRGMLSLLTTAAFAAGAVVAFRMDKPVFFCLSLIVVPLLPALYLPAVGTNAFSEHHLYLPSAGFVLLVGYAHVRLGRSRPALASLATACILVIAAWYAAATVVRNPVWKDELTLYIDTLAKSPDAAQIRYNLGIVYQEKGRLQEAADQYLAATKLDPKFERAYTNLGILYAEQGRFEEAMQAFQVVLRLTPEDAEAYLNIGNVHFDQGRPADAIAWYLSAVRLEPDLANARYNLGRAYALLGRTDDAVREFQRAVDLDPRDAEARRSLEDLRARMHSGSVRP